MCTCVQWHKAPFLLVIILSDGSCTDSSYINYSDYCCHYTDNYYFEQGSKTTWHTTCPQHEKLKNNRLVGRRTVLLWVNAATWLCLLFFTSLSHFHPFLFSPQWSHPSPGATLRAPHRKAKTLCWGAFLRRAPTPWNTAGRRPATTSCCPPPLWWVMDPSTSTPKQTQNSFQVPHTGALSV